MENPDVMTSGERRSTLALASIFSTRMLGLFMILPVFSVYAKELQGYTAALAGLAIGIYGLTQSMLQIPFGRLSDRIGRKPIIIIGLLIFALGSVVAALADSLMGVIIGRALQGAGAIAGAIMALAADLTREEQRMKVMAMIGMSIGLSFFVAIIAGPIIHSWLGVAGIFWLTAGLALLGIAIVVWRVPNPVRSSFHRDTEVEWEWLGRALANADLLRLDFSVLVLHFCLTSSLFALPLMLESVYRFEVTLHWLLYLPTMALSVVLVFPMIILAEKKHLIKQLVIVSVVFLALASVGFSQLSGQWWLLAILVSVFFLGFNFLEASLPSLVAKFSPVAHKGTAMGAYSSSQFMGAFLGASCAGLVLGKFGMLAIFLMNSSVIAVWLLVVLSMRQPPYLASQLLHIGKLSQAEVQELSMKLTEIRGVAEVVIIPEDGVAYLRVDKKALDKDALYAYSVVKA